MTPETKPPLLISSLPNRLCRNSTGISASRQTGLLSKLHFIKVSAIKLGSCLGISPYCLLLPGRTQSREETSTETAGITFPTDQAGAQLHFGPKSNLWCSTWNADPAVHWFWSLLKLCRSPFCLKYSSARWGSSQHCWRHKAPTLSRGCSEAAWKCSRDCKGGNTLSQVFWRRGKNPLRETNVWAPTVKQRGAGMCGNQASLAPPWATPLCWEGWWGESLAPK